MGTQVVHFPLSRKISSVLDKKPPGCFFCENEAVVVAWTTNSSPGRIFFLKEEEEEPTHPSNFAPSSSFHSFFSRTSYAAFPYTREKKLRGRKEGKQPPPPVAISHLSPTTHSFPFSFFLINHLLSPPFLFLFLPSSLLERCVPPLLPLQQICSHLLCAGGRPFDLRELNRFLFFPLFGANSAGGRLAIKRRIWREGIAQNSIGGKGGGGGGGRREILSKARREKRGRRG